MEELIEEQKNLIKKIIYQEGTDKRMNYIDIDGDECRDFIRAIEVLLNISDSWKEYAKGFGLYGGQHGV